MSFLTRAVNANAILSHMNVLRALRLQKPHLVLPSNLARRLSDSIHKTSDVHAGSSKIDDQIKNFFDYLMDVNKKFGLKNETISEFINSDMIAQLLNDRAQVFSNLECLEQLAGDDADMKKLVEQESDMYNEQLIKIDKQLLAVILDNLNEEEYSNVIIEISAGVGGTEAMIFVNDLCNMYIGYIEHLGLDYEVLSLQNQEKDAVRNILLRVVGNLAYRCFKFEGGVHRVQRVPATEKQGRMHTSTVTVVILPELEDIDIMIHEKDLKIESKKASGAGGQHVNTTDSSIRITHLPTGIAVTCQEHRVQHKNRQIAMVKLRNILYEQELEKQMSFKSMLTKKQRGTRLRNEKIRTYNYSQNRVTDHRIPDGTVHNLKQFMEGGPVFEKFVKRVHREMQQNLLLEIINKNQSRLN